MESEYEIQEEVYTKICKNRVNFKKAPHDRLTVAYLETRLENLERQWTLYNKTHNEILSTKKRDEYKMSEYYKNECYDKTEEVYLDFKTELKERLSRIRLEPKQAMSTSSTLSNNDHTCNNVKLPKITIPQFSGNYTQWSSFKDLFVSLIHENTSIDDVQKLQYLKGHLIGEAEQLLRHISVTTDNYRVCWDILKNRYDNKRFLSNCILKRLLGQKNITLESSHQIKEILDTTTECLNALTNLGVNVSQWDIIIIHIISLKLDSETRKQWECKVSSMPSDDLPTYKQFTEFLTSRFRALECLDPKPNRTNLRGLQQSFHVTSDDRKSLICKFCSGGHRISFCKNFLAEDCNSRRNFVQDNGMCYNCLGNNHSAKNCMNPSRCRICKKRHHSSLHVDESSETQVKSVENPSMSSNNELTSQDDEPSKSLISCFSSGRKNNTVLLATALVDVESKNGSFHIIRALLDQGSQASFITEDTVQYLGLKKRPSHHTIKCVGGDKVLTSKATVDLIMRSRVNPSIRINVTAFVLNSITTLLPVAKVTPVEWTDLPSSNLADPEYYVPNKINMLLGAEIYSKIIQSGLKRSLDGELVAQLTSLGWVISGPVRISPQDCNVSHSILLHAQVEEDLDMLKRFWEIEHEPTNEKGLLTEDEKLCEQHFTATTKRDENGRYIVRLPFRNNNEDNRCKGSKDIAERRFKGLERKLMKNQELKENYKEVIKEYMDLGHMEQVKTNDKKQDIAIYLPHHAVVREDKDTTKTRVVFDASCKGSNGISLNDSLLIGPTLQPDLRHIIMRWRTHPVCITADIVKMYRQIRVNEDDTCYQRILWKENPEDAMQEFELKTVTFGTASAPYLAIKTLQQTAYDEGHNYPLAAKRVLTDFYVDDLMTGSENIEEGVQVINEMNALLSKGGFQLQKWSSNNAKLLDELQKNSKTSINIKTDDIIKILGISWDRCEDSFQYKVTLLPPKKPETKRTIISEIAKLFDPLGWAAPCIVLAKMFIQKLWLANIEWDEKVPNNLLTEWQTYREQIGELTNMKIPRWLNIKGNSEGVELHGFCDASKLAYAAVVYIRVKDSNGSIHVHLITAKTKVAPIKQISIPRLELCGAVLLTRLMIEVSNTMNIDKSNVFAWTDSEVVLAWLKSHPSRWKTFVANRVAEILESFESNRWYHVSSKQNPADYASRGLRPSELLQTPSWLKGPDFLRKNIIQMQSSKVKNTDLEEIKVCTTSDVIQSEMHIWSKYSSLTKLVRVIAFCRRFLKFNRARVNGRFPSYLTSIELDDALNVCIRNCQNEEFSNEIENLRKGKGLHKSNIKSLNVFFDDANILRVGGRLEHSKLDYSQKHPILIPKKSYFTDLLIADAHIKTLHGGQQLMLNFLHTKFWILGVKQLVKSHIKKCVVCVRYNATTKTQLMGQLPNARVSVNRPFSHSGVDYAGPIDLRTSKGRGQHATKGYICLFVCMSTKAIHLEVVSDLTSKGFISAFRRFVARRGHCSNLYSDNGTNFVGAARELKFLGDIKSSNVAKDIADWLSSNGTQWHFIPPHAPHFGGLWEAGIKSTKNHLKRVIGNSKLTYEEMSTMLTQIEACLNSRPLTRVKDSINDPMALTPGHFLISEPLVTVPDVNYENANVNSLSRWQLTQRMVQNFWRRWSQEYLRNLQQRYKWAHQKPEPNIGDIVLVKEDNLPPGKWLLGKIEKKHPGEDEITRVVTIRLKNTLIKRPIHKLCVLPVS